MEMAFFDLGIKSDPEKCDLRKKSDPYKSDLRKKSDPWALFASPEKERPLGALIFRFIFVGVPDFFFRERPWVALCPIYGI